jgi:hypothetical protein
VLEASTNPLVDDPDVNTTCDEVDPTTPTTIPVDQEVKGRTPPAEDPLGDQGRYRATRLRLRLPFGELQDPLGDRLPDLVATTIPSWLIAAAHLQDTGAELGIVSSNWLDQHRGSQLADQDSEGPRSVETRGSTRTRLFQAAPAEVLSDSP